MSRNTDGESFRNQNKTTGTCFRNRYHISKGKNRKENIFASDLSLNIYHKIYRIQRSCSCLRVSHADRGRSLLRTPGPVPFWTCICSTCRDQSLSHIFWPGYALPRYFLDLPWLVTCFKVLIHFFQSERNVTNHILGERYEILKFAIEISHICTELLTGGHGRNFSMWMGKWHYFKLLKVGILLLN